VRLKKKEIDLIFTDLID